MFLGAEPKLPLETCRSSTMKFSSAQANSNWFRVPGQEHTALCRLPAELPELPEPSQTAWPSNLIPVDPYLFDGPPLEGVVLADEAVGHADEVLAHLLEVPLALIGAQGVRGGVGGQRQKLHEGHHVRGLEPLLPDVPQGLSRDVQQGAGLGQTAETSQMSPQSRLRR